MSPTQRQGGIPAAFQGFTSIFGFRSGGQVRGPGTSTSDSIPAMLSDGEFVIRAKAAQENLPLLQAINDGRVPRFNTGGLVGSSPMPEVPNLRFPDGDPGGAELGYRLSSSRPLVSASPGG